MTVRTANGILYIEFSSRPSLEEIKDALGAVWEADESRLRLWHFKDGLEFAPEEIRAIADFAQSRQTNPERVAIVSPQNLGYGILRMFNVYRGEDETAVKIFRTEGDAYRFLQEGLSSD